MNNAFNHVATVRNGQPDAYHAKDSLSRVLYDGSTYYYESLVDTLEQFTQAIASAFDVDASRIVAEPYADSSFKVWID